MRMRPVRFSVTTLAIVLFMCVCARGADQSAKLDGNGNPTLIGKASGTAEIRNVRVTDDGILYVAASGTVALASTTVNVGNNVALASATVNVGNKVDLATTTVNVGNKVDLATTSVNVSNSVSLASATVNIGNTVDTAFATGTVNIGNSVSLASATVSVGNSVSLASATMNIGNTVPVTGTMSYTPILIADYDYSTATIVAATTTTFTAPASPTVAMSIMIVNESSTQSIRFCFGCTLNDTCTFAASGGIGLVAGASYAMDGASVTTVNFCNGAGAPADVAVQWGRKP